MTKIYDIISLNGEMYMVDKEAGGKTTINFITDGEQVKLANNQTELDNPMWFKIIASSDKSLGLPLLPEIKEDIFSKRQEFFEVWNTKAGNKEKDGHHTTIKVLTFDKLEDAQKFCEGKNHLQILPDWIVVNSKKYTEDDVIYAFEHATDSSCKFKNGKEFVQSLKSFPIQVEVEMARDGVASGQDCIFGLDCSDTLYTLKVDSNNTIIVKKYIYG